MSRIELTGLIGSHPLGALASFGLLRVLSERDNDARLSFVEKDDWIAVLDSAFDTEQNLLAFLNEWGTTRAPEVLAGFGEDDVRVAPSRFQGMLRDALSGAAQNPEHASFLVALAADGAKDKSKGFVKPSPFYMASGQQSFLDTLKKIHGHVRKGGLWREALFGPWTYATSEWGAGWDPGTERMHALRFKAPTKDKTACVPIFPTLSVSGAVHTVGWVEHDRLDHFRWALPNVPIGIDALGVLLAADELGGGNKGKKTRRRLRDGIGAVYESTRHEFGQGYAVFRPARRLA
jgi:hypothetical protein